ncbi:MAG: hypothetical protein P9L97_01770 [Candidatus Tenebribacter davisii]|jgi:PBP1b-binding outer membrane lipoprotein LpoB|nr:hypothetical protein [Candidatus Tenebribacter davisii]
MKKIIVFVIFIAVLFTGCGKLKEAKKAMNAVKQAAEVIENTSNSFKDLSDEEVKKIKLNKKEVKTFFNNVSKLQEKYPDIHFQVAPVALVEALGAGMNLKDIVTKEMNISFDEYTKLSTVITYNEAVGAGLHLSKSLYEQMISSRENMKTQLDDALDSEQKKELEEALAETERQIKEFEQEMKSDDYANMKSNFDLIQKIKEDLDI